SGDGLTNDEKRVLGLDIYKTDTTGDGLPDWWLVEYGLNALDPNVGATDPYQTGLTVRQNFLLGTRPDLSDTDGDGWNDFDEIMADTSPLDSQQFPNADLSPWISTGINERRAGAVYRVEDEFRLISDSRDLTGTEDGFRFLSQEITGDFEFSAQVVG